ncbi:DUF6782 family putative metallopeptidase [Aliiroseovarius sp. F20344]|uniref:DUF6782 family putative metallopeptidase n=1 Tax=Aliiroseovarius sp. F20344 TaxID=2926414 RepID=UPI001FF11842|nr:DUF6782 family putative metallopeptidase [Aliiroseovarius sp. F20344]MCK0141575.1 hypothetical protein [Aliiroseovarius sp. F20344]
MQTIVDNISAMPRLSALFLILSLVMPATLSAEPCINLVNPAPETEDQKKLTHLLDSLQPTFARFPTIGRTISATDTSLCFSDQMNNAIGFLDTEGNRIVIEPDLPLSLQRAVLLHELRHLWQSMNGTCPSTDLAMKEYAHATFALEADASAITLLIAWDMKETGDETVWTALSDWASQSDIAARFEQTMSDTQDAGAAVSAAFDQWYVSPKRREIYYIEACSNYLDWQEANHQIPLYHTLETGFYEALCKLPDGRAYHCVEPEGADR